MRVITKVINNKQTKKTSITNKEAKQTKKAKNK